MLAVVILDRNRAAADMNAIDAVYIATGITLAVFAWLEWIQEGETVTSNRPVTSWIGVGAYVLIVGGQNATADTLVTGAILGVIGAVCIVSVLGLFGLGLEMLGKGLAKLLP